MAEVPPSLRPWPSQPLPSLPSRRSQRSQRSAAPRGPRPKSSLVGSGRRRRRLPRRRWWAEPRSRSPDRVTCWARCPKREGWRCKMGCTMDGRCGNLGKMLDGLGGLKVFCWTFRGKISSHVVLGDDMWESFTQKIPRDKPCPLCTSSKSPNVTWHYQGQLDLNANRVNPASTINPIPFPPTCPILPFGVIRRRSFYSKKINAKSNNQQLVYYWDNTCCICIRSPALVYAVADNVPWSKQCRYLRYPQLGQFHSQISVMQPSSEIKVGPGRIRFHQNMAWWTIPIECGYFFYMFQHVYEEIFIKLAFIPSFRYFSMFGRCVSFQNWDDVTGPVVLLASRQITRSQDERLPGMGGGTHPGKAGSTVSIMQTSRFIKKLRSRFNPSNPSI